MHKIKVTHNRGLIRGVVVVLLVVFAILAIDSTRLSDQLPDVIRQMLADGSNKLSGSNLKSQPTPNLATLLHPKEHIGRPPSIKTLHWTVTSDFRRPDGVNKKVYLINGQFPGPLIEVRSGDMLVVQVENALADGEGMSIHWHGLHQRGSLDMDGAVGYTQAPIPAGGNMTYDFKVSNDQHGTFWYHAHDQVQRGDGLYGGLIVHKPTLDVPSEQESYEYEQEHVLMVGDWYHRQSRDVMAWYQTAASFGNEPVPDSLLVNGQGAYNCSLSVVARPIDCIQRSQVEQNAVVVPGPGRYRYRLINVGTLAGLTFSFGGAAVTAIQVDGGHQITMESGSQVGILHPGERVDILVDWSAEASSILISLDEESFRYPNPALEVDHLIPVTLGSQKIFSAPPETTSIAGNLSNVMALTTADIPPEADETFVVYVTSVKLAHLDNIPTGFINHTTWKPAQIPLISSLRSTWDENQLVPFIPLVESNPLWIDVVINNLDDGSHPFHLHGNDFYILRQNKGGSYWGSYNPFEDEEMPGGGAYNILNPVVKDTVVIPSRGFAVIRFRADNPGVWLFHCHVMWHLGSGMAMGLHVGNDKEHVGEWLKVASKVLELCNASLAQVLLDNALGIGVLEGQHAAAGVLDEDDLLRAEQLLRDDERAQGVACVAAGVADDMGVAELNAVRGRRVDACVHAGDWRTHARGQ
ncbi:hypothetical protein FH972_023454 [Carpinus fangiana]|uniref:Laccase n=1 Tax=Carpinus fangiana TaxID=176857 RepID=A0A5N6KVH0_9ROSI|nr:hypothetical protein FH972_023454 [Carpinus fangiana]